MKTFRFKLYHSDHNNKLMKQINAAGLLYNHCIALHRRYYRLYGKYLNANRLKVHLTKLKKTKRFAYICGLGSQAIQDVAERIDRAYNLFWSNLKDKVKCSPPKFKKVCKYKSFTLKQAGVGDIYVYLVCDAQLKQVEARTGEIVGFDFGLKRFLTGSDGRDIDSPDFFKHNTKSIKTKCRKLSSKKQGSHHREQARKDLARAYRKLENQRKDFHFKTARKLCEEYALICLETLNIKGMAKLWGRKIHSLGFASFVRILEYEAMKFGTQIIFVPRDFPSSQLCHICGYKNPAVKDLRVREWDCPSCQTHHDRDKNAAKNIYQVGTSTCREDTVSPEQSGSIEDTRILRTDARGVCQQPISYTLQHERRNRNALA